MAHTWSFITITLVMASIGKPVPVPTDSDETGVDPRLILENCWQFFFKNPKNTPKIHQKCTLKCQNFWDRKLSLFWQGLDHFIYGEVAIANPPNVLPFQSEEAFVHETEKVPTSLKHHISPPPQPPQSTSSSSSSPSLHHQRWEKCKSTCTTTCKEGATRCWVVKQPNENMCDPLQIQIQTHYRSRGWKTLARIWLTMGEGEGKSQERECERRNHPSLKYWRYHWGGKEFSSNQSNKKYVDSVKSCFKITMDYLKLGTMEESHIYVNLFLWRIPRIYICYGPNQPRFDTNIEKYETTQSVRAPWAPSFYSHQGCVFQAHQCDHWSLIR